MFFHYLLKRFLITVMQINVILITLTKRFNSHHDNVNKMLIPIIIMTRNLISITVDTKISFSLP